VELKVSYQQVEEEINSFRTKVHGILKPCFIFWLVLAAVIKPKFCSSKAFSHLCSKQGFDITVLGRRRFIGE